MKISIIGAGITGCTCAYLLKKEHDVTIYEKDKIGGLCRGVTYHESGPHIFYTDDEEVMSLIKEWGGLKKYEHRVRVFAKNLLLPYPLNFDSRSVFQSKESIMEHIVLPYSKKRWDMHYDEIKHTLINEVTRNSYDDRYTRVRYQGLPNTSYHKWFKNALDGVKIRQGEISAFNLPESDVIIMTGRIDKYWHCDIGELKFRGVTFSYANEMSSQYAVINYPSEHIPFIRTIDYRHITGSNIFQMEFAVSAGDQYPLSDKVKYDVYTKNIPTNMILCGRLGSHKYMNMEQCIRQAIDICKKI